MKTCTVDGCKQPHLAKGLCRPHYQKARYSPHPREPLPPDPTNAKRVYVWAWMLENGLLCKWAMPSRAALVKDGSPSTGATPVRMMMGPPRIFRKKPATSGEEKK